jgi:hypothetical protein
MDVVARRIRLVTMCQRVEISHLVFHGIISIGSRSKNLRQSCSLGALSDSQSLDTCILSDKFYVRCVAVGMVTIITFRTGPFFCLCSVLHLQQQSCISAARRGSFMWTLP